MVTRLLIACLFGGFALTGDAETASPALLSAYVGIVNSARVYDVAECSAAAGQVGVGMPLVFDVEIDQSTLDPSDFLITYRDTTGALMTVSPDCVSMAPADEEYEDRTVLTVGQFGDGITVQRVEVAANSNLADETGGSLAQLAAQQIALFGAPERLVYAEILAEDEWERGECPIDTALAIQVTWNGGIVGPAATQVDDDIQPEDYTITFLYDDGRVATRHPGALADLNDGDNNHILCVTSQFFREPEKILVTGLAGQFCSPGDICTQEDALIILP